MWASEGARVVGQGAEIGQDMARACWHPVDRCAGAIDPYSVKAVARGPGDIPSVRGDEEHLIGGGLEALADHVIDRAGRFEDADVVYRKRVVERGAEAGEVARALEHLGRSVRQDRVG